MSSITIRGKKPLLDRIISKLNRSKPRDDDDGTFRVVKTTSGVLSSVKYVLTTGLKPFDDVTGGLPFGRVVEIYGMDQSGKTALVIRSAIRAQQGHIYEKIRDPDGSVALRRLGDDVDVTVLYVDNEGSLEDDSKTQLWDEYDPESPPVRLDAVNAEADTIMQMFKLMDRTAELLDEEERDSGRKQFMVVVVDTIASTSSAEEIKSDWGKVDYQRQPKQLREGFRRMIREINRRNICMLCVNQISEKFDKQAGGRKYGGNTPQDEDYSAFGGRALRYYASLRVFCYKLGTIKLSATRKFADGLLIGFKTTKNRMVPPLREGRLALMFNRGYQETYSILETLLFLQFAGFGSAGKSIFFRFKGRGLSTTTFEVEAPTRRSKAPAEDGDEREVNPEISNKLEWKPFYLAHREDFDVMWDAAVKSIFAAEGAAPPEEDADDDDDELPRLDEVDG